MIVNAYAVYDNKALVYAPPFFAANHAVATRMFGEAVRDPQSYVSRHPGDYVMFCVGRYDDQKGQLMPMVPVEHVIDAQALVVQQVQPGLFAELSETHPGAKVHSEENR